jgi:hypothetical protein
MVKNHPKSSIITLKEHPKTLQNLFLLDIPKWIFISGTRNLAHEKMVEKHPKSSIITLKAPKKHYKIACFYALQNGFSFLDQPNWHMQKALKKSQKLGL